MSIQRVVILGAGGLGAAYGSRFLRAPGFETEFIARGERNERLQQEGLIVNGELYDVPVIHPDDEDAQTADLILVALKQQRHLIWKFRCRSVEEYRQARFFIINRCRYVLLVFC